MTKEKKWEYSDLNLNLLNSKTDSDRFKKMFDIIDESKKKELQDIFDNAIKIKYDLYKQYLFEYNLFLFKDLEYNIKESVYCLIISAHTASITNTNLILERSIKLALIQYQAETLTDYSDDQIIEKYIASDKKYSGKNLDQNIQTCLKFGILNKEEAKELKEYKLKFRDGFSHFTPKNILKGEESLIDIQGYKNPNLQRYLSMPTYQGAEVRQFAVNNAAKHLEYILKIINHLQYKVLEKFKKNRSTAAIS